MHCERRAGILWGGTKDRINCLLLEETVSYHFVSFRFISYTQIRGEGSPSAQVLVLSVLTISSDLNRTVRSKMKSLYLGDAFSHRGRTRSSLRTIATP